MRKTLALFSLSLGITFFNPLQIAVSQVSPTAPPLKLVDIGTNCTPHHACLGWDEQLFSGHRGLKSDRQGLLNSIDNSLRYLETPKAVTAYDNYPIKEITRDRVRRSLRRFRQLVATAKSPAQLQAAVRREFAFYKSVGDDGQGTVKFTAYYAPIYQASRVRTAQYKYPIYRVPPDFEQWTKPHPKRVELEGVDGLLGEKSQLRGLEMFWLRDRFQAYMIHIQGSAKLNLTDGTQTSVGFVRGTDYPWTSIGRLLFQDGKLTKEELNMPGIIRYFRKSPQSMSNYLPRWERFIFFKETKGEPATGSISVPLVPERSIATDKSLMPPGALAVMNATFPYPGQRNQLIQRRVSRFVLDQDTGSAIKGPGRVDYFLGYGDLAGDRAGITVTTGSIYYLLLK
ncbi:MltA [Trichormus variabilis ATCC 29413]|uniref:peptidoglycan lytic exotransglycosylase n=3 Tax=Anabaena variabilis TaxID=264691 RepID=Q3MGB6_TRIV2|nr:MULTISPECIES: murein transglycosylase A [Nostocaceae]ABA19970.1 MltA [Trichormus variabilis ATCC 29413]MBC1216431.1 murein transglycosylase A [Trichormus variabilis ARAD]MBC1266526.1 murein transglycosylase A [Trichormus variabilis FSR]MBC1302853.1 murein transglycosylase A [Trichormus variabilis N2B]MBC1312265.1 murein transglycosylase A [Trichormus variabilis PNB]